MGADKLRGDSDILFCYSRRLLSTNYLYRCQRLSPRSMSSSSAFINGFGSNGIVPHNGAQDVPPEQSFENGTASTSSSVVNGHSQ